jgi:acetylornithine deacetylase/succinyl-diaminopimelate desuccinylase-like protein
MRALPCLLLLGFVGTAQAAEKLVFADIPVATSDDSLVSSTRDRLARLVMADTTNPPGNERALVDAVAADLIAEGIDVQVLGPEGPRANLIARVPAGRPLKGAKPLLIVAHIDVVNFTREAWSSDPLALTESDGYLYGRGVIDNKGMAAASIEILRRLNRSGTRGLRRDVVLLLAADEEAGGKAGTRWLLENHADVLAADFVINEGGDVRIVGDGVAYVGLQTTEKLSRMVTLVADGQDGHSSMPLPNNAITRLGAAIADVGTLSWPMRTNATTHRFLDGSASTLPAPFGDAARAAADLPVGSALPDAVVATLATDPFLNAFLRTTCVATMVSGGTRRNALPGRAEATVNCRLLPDEDWAAVVAAIEAAAAPHDVRIEATMEDKISPTSPESGLVFDAVSKAIRSTWRGATLVPFMSTGGTDCRRFRLAGTPCYGLLPFPLTAEDERRMHGTDERLPIASLDEGTRFLWRLVRELAKR